jgi:hypothetical protein
MASNNELGDTPRDRIRIGDLGPGDIALLKNVAVEAAEQTVRKWFTAMGLDIDDPFSAQRDFSALRDMTGMLKDDEFHRDLQWVRHTRRLHEGIVGKLIYSSIGIAVLGAASAAWSGFKALITAH